MRDITQDYPSIKEYVVRALDLVSLFSIAHGAALIQFSVPLNALPNAYSIVTYFCAALALPLLPRYEPRSFRNKQGIELSFLQLALALALIMGVKNYSTAHLRCVHCWCFHLY